MPVIHAKIGGAWVPINFASPPEVAIGPTTPTGNETLWIDTSTNPPTTKAFVSGAWVVVGAVAPEEVFIGASDPIATLPTVELWYDTDATGAPSLGGSLPVYATWAALLASTPPIAGSQAWVTQWNVMAVYNGTTWIVPRGTVLNQTATTGGFNNLTGNGQVEESITDAPQYPFATIARLDISGFYVKPDRGSVDLWAMLYTNNYAAPQSGGLIYDETAHQTSTGANFYLHRSLHGTQQIAANGTMTWVLRYTITTGGPTFFSSRYESLVQRIAA